MNKTYTKTKRMTAEQLITKDLMNAFIAEQFFEINDKTLKSPKTMQYLFPEYDQALLYQDEKICFLLKKSYRQGYEWATDYPIYINISHQWVQMSSPLALCEFVLRTTLTEEAFAHQGVADFLVGLNISVQQLKLSLEQVNHQKMMTPKSAYDWYVKGEMIASLRDRPFHPLSKAKIGFTDEDYSYFMAEFGKPATLCWVAVKHTAIEKGCLDDDIEILDVLKTEEKMFLEAELKRKKIAKNDYTVMPVHPWQMKHVILPDFQKELNDQTVIMLDTKIGDFLATSSVRSLTSVDESTYMLKLPISVKSLGAARYLPVVKLLNGIKGEQMFRQAIACDETLEGKVFLCEEKNWWGYMPKSMGLFDDHPRHLAAQVRIYPPEILKDGYKIIPMSSLGVTLEGEHFLTDLFGNRLSNEEVIDFYSDLTTMFYDITMRLFKVGIVPEIHGQNCCIVLNDKKIVGLLFRDHDSVRLHQPYLDQHEIKDPLYHIRPGYSNSLYNETIEKLIYYVQSLGTQVNLAAIMESLAEVYTIPEKLFWKITETKLREALQTIDISEIARKTLHDELFEKKEWPVKLVIRPLLEADGVPGAMPSGKGKGFNPFYHVAQGG